MFRTILAGGETLTAPVTHSLVKALRSVPDFASLDDRTLVRIVGASTNLFWRAGALVFEKGSSSEGLWIVLSGKVRIFDVEDGEEVDVSTVEPGNSFGELSLLLRTTHTKNAQAVEDTELMVVPEESFEELLDDNPNLAAVFQRRVRERNLVRGEVTESD
ncbi:MAG: cyclic nucleotide-binding domain-containing protein [Actinobacteria bacterium]|nr:cyclic nucleotide-binding domain-containing protein [Actinomycetota bacterium]